jgi:hypothetical protein
MTIHLFILESMVCAALYTTVKGGGGPEQQSMSFEELRKEVLFLSQLFRGEFIFPTEGLDHNLQLAIERLEDDKVLALTKEGDQVVAVGLSELERQSHRENFDFYCFLVWPFIEATWLGAVSLMMLAPAPGTTLTDSWLDAKKVHDMAQLLGKTLYHQGDLSYYEAVNKETLKNCYSRFAEEGIVITKRTQQPKSSQIVTLAEEWRPQRDSEGKLMPAGRLWEFTEAISHSRREGKNRRDGYSVQRRVLGLIDIVGKQIWEDKAREKDGALAAQGKKSRKRGRRSDMQPVAKL